MKHSLIHSLGGQEAITFENAGTLPLTLAQVFRPNPTLDVYSGAPVLSRKELLERRCSHRKDRVKQLHDFNSRNGALMASGSLYFQQALKEWAIWATLKLLGPGARVEWFYSHHCEDILAAFAA